MHNASCHNYWNCLVIVDLAMGQIPRSTERISSFERIMAVSVLNIPNVSRLR